MKKKSIDTNNLRKKNIAKPAKKESSLSGRDFLAILWRGLGVLAFITIISITLLPSFPVQLQNFKINDIASKNIKASEDFLVEDKISTEKNRDDAIENSYPVYDYNPETLNEINKKISSAFSSMEALYAESSPGIYKEIDEVNELLSISDELTTGKERNLYKKQKEEIDKKLYSIETSDYFKKKENEFNAALGIGLSGKSLKTLKWHHYNPKIVKQIQQLLSPVLQKGVISSRKTLTLQNSNGILIRDISSNAERVDTNLLEIKDIERAESYLEQEVKQIVNKSHKSLQRAILNISTGFLLPNLTFNSRETEIRKKLAAEMVKPVFSRMKKGEMIVREGEKITESHLMRLEGISSKKNINNALSSFSGIFLISALIGIFSWSYLKRFKPLIVSKKSNLMLLALILLSTTLISKLFVGISHALSEYAGFIEIQSYYYAIPYAAGPMLAAMLFGVDIGIVLSVITFIITGIMLDGQLNYALFALTGSLCAVLKESQYAGRLSILGAGLFISLINVCAIVPLYLVNSLPLSIHFLLSIAMGIVGGVIVSSVVSSLLPLLEYLFGVTTDIKLLELSNLNHPLLHEMLISAPGSHQHSMVVGSLAEEAAKSVNANYLLARVGSYYHDIGKIPKSEYFIENVMGGINKHDKLNPSMSSLILTSHVKDGVELAKKYKLQPALVDFILEHHGTDLIRYFYKRAKEKEFPEIESIKEEYFRYPGPKPQSKETAIVMLADSVEAASRTLTDPTPSRLKGLVEKIINDKFIDGQLEECNLTLKDLHNIMNSFVRILNGMFHSRVEYPESISTTDAKDKRGPIENTNDQSAEENKIKHFENKDRNLQNIKNIRLH